SSGVAGMSPFGGSAGFAGVAAALLGSDLRLSLVRECFGLDLNDGVGRTGAHGLNPVAAGCNINFSGYFAIVDHEIAALARTSANRRAGEEEQAARTHLRAERTGDRATARQRDFHPLRRVGAGAQVIRSLGREREVGNGAHRLRAHSLDLAI